ncbi:GNAT family N-acetyltransferase [Kitasatospora sp. GP82]|uniref:GNAT family N-acetyltransferase n=1 Tax=Kitasatospora sp. GP82 TaxID=3035089 RepID=UPI002475A032|nr:GNAT family N-acetyltransferase [Kitasatospora sp. GP82]MDH6126562.1 GNAT superfamily N-acetyltransferase [Kitasatospora sp. GP82]
MDADGLAEVEQVVVDGFPVAARQPWTRGGLLPPGLLELPGFRAWLARVDAADGADTVHAADAADAAAGADGVDGRPAAACVTYDNGETVGVYWVATLPDYRSRGLARAVLSHALEANPGRVAALTATLLGEPLYRRLGFTEQGLTRWWRPQRP